MSTYTFMTAVVKADTVTLARSLAAGLSGGGTGMFTAGLSPTGEGTPTHYISTGYIGEEFLPLMTDAAALHEACSAAGSQVTLSQCEALVASSSVSQDDPFTVMETLGLKLISEN